MFRGDFVSRRLLCRSVVLSGKSERIFSLVILAAAYSAGVLAGFLFGALSPVGEDLSRYLTAYFLSVGQGSLSLSFLPVVWDLNQWILLALVLSFSRLGLIGLPVLLTIRGFLLSHAVSVFVHALGGRGFRMALVVFGVPAVLVVPVLFALCCDGHLALRRQNSAPISAERVALWGVCAGMLVIAVAVQWTLMPTLVSALCKRFF